ncbi:DUF4397 domain-containing protein [Dyadobacter frigoris]|uniref:DUF4397 domain-containing protein n=1 Tax=Dyadobacter frigoris TaxID=2576211 RepID=A0A4U6D402_9BACT|nr:DUF4397 domain-containing protein [Dyadobacter frigoris]TKT90668.1 DUF4397 domain-containing protein [Dyadobacter frigoris]GLU51178.1 hypothetical protein Dfri01_06390 [Dyadobacter frigoris]
MKNKSIFSRSLLAAGMLLFAILVWSCEENDVDASGMARVKIVNASPNSAAQRFFLVDKALVNGGLKFTDASDYLSTNSGKTLVAEFKNESSSSVTARGWAYLLDGDSYTIYLAGEGSDERVKQYEDDLSAPASGMARIKFIHFSNEAPSLLTIKNASEDNLIGTLTRDIESKYLNVTPGTFTFKVYDFVRKNKIGDYQISDLQAGKIYTVYFTGSQGSDINVHQIVHN